MIKVQFLQNDFFRNTATLTIGTVVSQIIGVAFIPILTRIYDPHDYGQFAVFSSLAAIIASLISLRYEIQIVKARDDEEAVSLLLLVISIAFLFSLLFSIISFVFFGDGVLSQKIPGLHYWLNYCVLSSFFLTCVTAFISWLHRKNRYKSMAIFRMLQVFMTSGLSFMFGYFLVGFGLIMGAIAGLGVTFLILTVVCVPMIRKHFVSIDKIKEAAHTYKKTPFFLLPTAMLDVITLQLPVFLISFWFTTEKAGNFRMASSLLMVPVVVIGGAISQVFFQKYSSFWPDASECRKFLFQTWKMLALFSAAPMLLIFLFGQYLFTFFLGPTWHEAGIIGSILAPMTFFSLVHSATSTTLVVMGKEKIIFFFGIAVLFYRPLSLFIGYISGNFYFGLILFAICEVIQVFIFQYLVWKELNTRCLLNEKGLHL